MNWKACSPCYGGTDNRTSLLFETILPYLVQGLLFGGVPPYVIHVGDFSSLSCKEGTLAFCNKYTFISICFFLEKRVIFITIGMITFQMDKMLITTCNSDQFQNYQNGKTFDFYSFLKTHVLHFVANLKLGGLSVK